ncbi:serine/threonine protein kinase [Paenibacillus macerans]|uniref:serine/threonine protein kinase n=1 Tax=Paenibacillus macerans TaxID=44252 RepID=UPI003D315466
MESSATTSSKINLPQGTRISGRWKGGRYVIQRLLGQGANGVVYLVKREKNAKLYALKLGFDTLDIQSEINVLKALQRQGRRSGAAERDLAYLVEVDDYSYQGREIPFYVMRYVQGEPLRAFLARRGPGWLDVAGGQLLQQLRRLHQSGWIFGDLKPENVLVASYGEVELIDYGGVTGIGRSVKQFTEWYDRGFWGAGSRTADPAYDLFSFAVVCIHLLAEPSLKKAATQLPQMRSRSDLAAIVDGQEALAPYRAWLKRALHGEFRDTAEACRLWQELVSQRFAPRRRSRPSTPGWIIGAFAISITLLACALYLTLRF